MLPLSHATYQEIRASITRIVYELLAHPEDSDTALLSVLVTVLYEHCEVCGEDLAHDDTTLSCCPSCGRVQRWMLN